MASCRSPTHTTLTVTYPTSSLAAPASLGDPPAEGWAEKIDLG